MTNLEMLENLDQDLDLDDPSLLRQVDAPTLPPEGYYTIVLTDWEFPTGQDGTAPINRLQVNSVEILEAPPEGATFVGRRVFRFNPVWTKTYTNRQGIKTSGLAQLCMGIDDTVHIKTLKDAGDLLQKASDQRIPIRCQLIWEGFDRDYWTEQGGPSMSKGEEMTKLRTLCSTKYMRNYPTLPNGTSIAETTGPSGNTIEARLTIDRVVPSSKRRG